MNGSPFGSVPTSRMRTQCGVVSDARARCSRLKRSSDSASAPSTGARTFNATSSPACRSKAEKIWAMPPEPITASTRQRRPMTSPISGSPARGVRSVSFAPSASSLCCVGGVDGRPGLIGHAGGAQSGATMRRRTTVMLSLPPCAFANITRRLTAAFGLSSWTICVAIVSFVSIFVRPSEQSR